MVQLFTGNVVDAAFATGDTVHHGPRSAAGAVAHLRVDDSEEPCRCGVTVAGDVPVGIDGVPSESLEGDASHYSPVA